jgi:hypothetical protein
MSSLAIVLSIKLMEVLYIPGARQWFSLLCSQVDTSRSAHLGYPERTFPAGGKLVHALPVKHPSEHQIIHLELSALHEPLMVALKVHAQWMMCALSTGCETATQTAGAANHGAAC